MTTPANAAVLLAVALCAAYGADSGRGFIKDDFRWIRETRLASIADIPPLFGRTDGFYRPLVSLSFSINSALGGLTPRQYGLTNFAMLSVAAGLVWVLGQRLGLDVRAALLAAGVWAFNFHGINMAVLWISGRTALLVTLFALLTGIATVAGRAWLAGGCCLLALFSKEEAVLLPVVMAAWSAYDATGSPGQRATIALRRTWPCFAALAVYMALRLQTDAFWVADAPSYYRLTVSPGILATNVVQYADRAVTWPAVAAVALFASSAGRARLDPIEKRVVLFGAIWLAGHFALTIFVPVRSSLYAVLPSVGSALAAGAVASAALRALPRRAGTVMAALAVLPLLLVPVYWLRNDRWVQLAQVSAHVLAQVRATADRQPQSRIVLVDNPLERFNLDAAFGSLWPDASALFLPRGTVTRITHDARGVSPDAIVLRLERGRLVQER